ncbi:MAG TPA: tRNA lysidine(34) synthetase TilS [Dehalococcoidia bacterium]|nr:tRNA lysidine(34) synthetase TilS [Dehalococcoidia bacterium]
MSRADLVTNKKNPLVEERVLQFIAEHRLLLPGQCLVVAVSGGADSVCLLHALLSLKERLGITLHLAHLNHQLRGAESAADADYVAGLARRLGVPATIERRDVKAYQDRQRLSLEEAAREVRYGYLAEVARSLSTGCVATGHTRDDHIETILMHLIRGTGPRGLRGLRPQSEWRSGGLGVTIVRPLLGLGREETAEYCAHHRLAPRLDTSNLSLSPLRNRIRQQLLPLLRSYNPAVDEALQRTARLAGDDSAFMDEEAGRRWGEVVQKQGDIIILDREGFGRLPLALKRHLLRAVIESLVDSVRDIEMRHIDGVLAALGKPAGRRLDLPLGLTFAIEYDRFLIGRDTTALCPFPVLDADAPLKVPGETRLPGWRVRTTVMSPKAITSDTDGFQAYLDLDRSGTGLVVRRRRPGDRFQPLGMSQPKKLNEFMIDARIPRHWRPRIPIVSSSAGILWVVGWRIDERVKVTAATRRVLDIEFEQA